MGYRYEQSGRAQWDQQMVAPYKNIDWDGLKLPSKCFLPLLQSFRDKVVSGIREFPVETERVLAPVLEELKIDISFHPRYRGELHPDAEYGSKLEMEDILGSPIGCRVYVDEEDFLKLKNIHF